MPINVDSKLRILSKQEFHSAAHRATGVAFETHQHFCRLIDEAPFTSALAHRFAASGFELVRREVQITLEQEGFRKQLL